MRDAVGRQEPLDDGDLAVGAGVDHEPREHGRATSRDGMGHGDRAVDDHALRDGEHHRRHERGVELGEGVGGITGEELEATWRELRADPLGADDVGSDRSRPEAFEVELTDPAVAPDLLIGGGQLGGRESLGRSQPLLEDGAGQIWIEDADRVGGERRHGLNSTIRVVVIATCWTWSDRSPFDRPQRLDERLSDGGGRARAGGPTPLPARSRPRRGSALNRLRSSEIRSVSRSNCLGALARAHLGRRGIGGDYPLFDEELVGLVDIDVPVAQQRCGAPRRMTIQRADMSIEYLAA